MSLAFGYSAGLPADCEVAWGCRAIIDEVRSPRKNGTKFRLDIPWDRKSIMGPETEVKKLVDILNKHFEAILEAGEKALSNYVLVSSEAKEHLLWEGDGVTVMVNTNGSYGYLYMCAFFSE